MCFFSGPNVQGWASGWGVIDPNNKAVQAKKLQKIDVYTMPQRECEDYYDNDGSVTDTMMCAKSYKGMKGNSSSSDLLVLEYGNTGCWVFKRGVLNWKDFCLKINIPKESY